MRERFRAVLRYASAIAVFVLVSMAGHADVEWAARRACERDGTVDLLGATYTCERADSVPARLLTSGRT